MIIEGVNPESSSGESSASYEAMQFNCSCSEEAIVRFHIRIYMFCTNGMFWTDFRSMFYSDDLKLRQEWCNWIP